jgi:hypothetical protein
MVYCTPPPCYCSCICTQTERDTHTHASFTPLFCTHASLTDLHDAHPAAAAAADAQTVATLERERSLLHERLVQAQAFISCLQQRRGASGGGGQKDELLRPCGTPLLLPVRGGARTGTGAGCDAPTPPLAGPTSVIADVSPPTCQQPAPGAAQGPALPEPQGPLLAPERAGGAGAALSSASSALRRAQQEQLGLREEIGRARSALADIAGRLRASVGGGAASGVRPVSIPGVRGAAGDARLAASRPQSKSGALNRVNDSSAEATALPTAAGSSSAYDDEAAADKSATRAAAQQRLQAAFPGLSTAAAAAGDAAAVTAAASAAAGEGRMLPSTLLPPRGGTHATTAAPGGGAANGGKPGLLEQLIADAESVSAEYEAESVSAGSGACNSTDSNSAALSHGRPHRTGAAGTASSHVSRALARDTAQVDAARRRLAAALSDSPGSALSSAGAGGVREGQQRQQQQQTALTPQARVVCASATDAGSVVAAHHPLAGTADGHAPVVPPAALQATPSGVERVASTLQTPHQRNIASTPAAGTSVPDSVPVTPADVAALLRRGDAAAIELLAHLGGPGSKLHGLPVSAQVLKMVTPEWMRELRSRCEAGTREVQALRRQLGMATPGATNPSSPAAAVPQEQQQQAAARQQEEEHRNSNSSGGNDDVCNTAAMQRTEEVPAGQAARDSISGASAAMAADVAHQPLAVMGTEAAAGGVVSKAEVEAAPPSGEVAETSVALGGGTTACAIAAEPEAADASITLAQGPPHAASSPVASMAAPSTAGVTAARVGVDLLRRRAIAQAAAAAAEGAEPCSAGTPGGKPCFVPAVQPVGQEGLERTDSSGSLAQYMAAAPGGQDHTGGVSQPPSSELPARPSCPTPGSERSLCCATSPGRASSPDALLTGLSIGCDAARELQARLASQLAGLRAGGGHGCGSPSPTRHEAEALRRGGSCMAALAGVQAPGADVSPITPGAALNAGAESRLLSPGTALELLFDDDCSGHAGGNDCNNNGSSNGNGNGHELEDAAVQEGRATASPRAHELHSLPADGTSTCGDTEPSSAQPASSAPCTQSAAAAVSDSMGASDADASLSGWAVAPLGGPAVPGTPSSLQAPAAPCVVSGLLPHGTTTPQLQQLAAAPAAIHLGDSPSIVQPRPPAALDEPSQSAAASCNSASDAHITCSAVHGTAALADSPPVVASMAALAGDVTAPACTETVSVTTVMASPPDVQAAPHPVSSEPLLPPAAPTSGMSSGSSVFATPAAAFGSPGSATIMAAGCSAESCGAAFYTGLPHAASGSAAASSRGNNGTTQPTDAVPFPGFDARDAPHEAAVAPQASPPQRALLQELLESPCSAFSIAGAYAGGADAHVATTAASISTCASRVGTRVAAPAGASPTLAAPEAQASAAALPSASAASCKAGRTDATQASPSLSDYGFIDAPTAPDYAAAEAALLVASTLETAECSGARSSGSASGSCLEGLSFQQRMDALLSSEDEEEGEEEEVAATTSCLQGEGLAAQQPDGAMQLSSRGMDLDAVESAQHLSSFQGIDALQEQQGLQQQQHTMEPCEHEVPVTRPAPASACSGSGLGAAPPQSTPPPAPNHANCGTQTSPAWMMVPARQSVRFLYRGAVSHWCNACMHWTRALDALPAAHCACCCHVYPSIPCAHHSSRAPTYHPAVALVQGGHGTAPVQCDGATQVTPALAARHGRAAAITEVKSMHRAEGGAPPPMSPKEMIMTGMQDNNAGDAGARRRRRWADASSPQAGGTAVAPLDDVLASPVKVHVRSGCSSATHAGICAIHTRPPAP